MGKNKGNKKMKDLFKSEMKEIQQEEQRLHKKRRALAAACQHRDGKEIAVDYLKKGKVVCRLCGSRFTLETYKVEDIKNAAYIIKSALQQVRILADPEDDARRITELGRLSADVESVSEIYQRHLERYGKNQNHKNKEKRKDRYEDDDLGGYNGIIDIMDGVLPKKKKRK